MAVQGGWPLPEGVKAVEVNGYPMAYQDSGSGTPLILVHGSLNDYRYWKLQIPSFAVHHRVIAVSLRHYFPEPWDGRGDDFSILQHADDVAEFTRVLGLGPVHLLGHSRGGAVALDVAARHSEVIRTLILVDASGLEALLPDTPESRALLAESMQLRERLAADMVKGDREAGVRAFVQALSGPARWQQMNAEQKSILFDNAATAIRVEGRPLLSCDTIRQFRFPILRLIGERSPRRYGEMFRAMGACLSGNFGEPIVISNAAHGMNRENPQAFDAAILGFLSGR